MKVNWPNAVTPIRTVQEARQVLRNTRLLAGWAVAFASQDLHKFSANFTWKALIQRQKNWKR